VVAIDARDTASCRAGSTRRKAELQLGADIVLAVIDVAGGRLLPGCQAQATAAVSVQGTSFQGGTLGKNHLHLITAPIHAGVLAFVCPDVPSLVSLVAPGILTRVRESIDARIQVPGNAFTGRCT
jgi:hypothetical protein